MPCSKCASENHSATGSGTQERVRYFPRQLLTADDMRTEQEYCGEKQRRHNRMLHGWGVVCGLDVVADTHTGPMAIQIFAGYALSPCGHEICLYDSFDFDLTNCSKPKNVPCLPTNAVTDTRSKQPATLLVKIRYAECLARPMRTLPAGCGCDDSSCEYSRIRDGFEVNCVLAMATQFTDKNIKTKTTKTNTSTGCPPCPDDLWLVLAQVQ